MTSTDHTTFHTPRYPLHKKTPHASHSHCNQQQRSHISTNETHRENISLCHDDAISTPAQQQAHLHDSQRTGSERSNSDIPTPLHHFKKKILMRQQRAQQQQRASKMQITPHFSSSSSDDSTNLVDISPIQGEKPMDISLQLEQNETSDESDADDFHDMIDPYSDPVFTVISEAKVSFFNENYFQSFKVLQDLKESDLFQSVTREDKVAVLYNQAISLYQEKEYVWSLNIITDEILPLDSSHAHSLELKGDVHMSLNEYQHALESYQEAINESAEGEASSVLRLKKTEAKYKALQEKCHLYLARLGLNRDMMNQYSSESLKTQYRSLCRRFHPDRFCGSDPLIQELAAKRFTEIQEAYIFLREKYVQAEENTKSGDKFELLSFQYIASPAKLKKKPRQKQVSRREILFDNSG